ncbi:MAG: B12-binding domain-containing radical SAM protein [Candidatus Aminicenantes bacterium]|nr:B12-binding domain-containing radical SAM protein [Candidatus Aminicenantes bacterium]
MRILLINPPRWNELVGKNPAIIEKHRGFNPPLGLLYLAASIKKNTSHEIEVLDAQPLQWTYRELETYLKGKTYDLVGISVMTFTLIDAFKTVRVVKRAIPEAKIVLGGAHVHLFPEETKNLEGVDFAFMGEAEFSFIKFLSCFENGQKSFENVPGLVFNDNQGKIIKNNIEIIRNLDEVPLPERSLVGIKNYSSLLSRGNLCTTVITSRGCPFHCTFCDRPLSPITSIFRYRSAKNVVEEIRECMEYGIKDFLFYDDTFTVNRDRVLAICEEILRHNLKIRWDVRTRVDLVDEEILRMMKRAGCVAIHYGVESGNDDILKILQKGFTVKKVKETFALTKKIGLETLAYFMIGLPSENLKHIQDTFDLAKELRPDYTHFTIFSPYPGTKLYFLGMEKGIIKRDIWREFARDPNKEFRVPVWEENFSRDELYEIIVKFYKKFYLRPRYLFSRLIKTRSVDELIKKTKAGASVLTMKKSSVDKLK